MKKLSLSFIVTGLCLTLALPGFGMGGRPPFESQLMARAEVDECFNGIGQPYQPGPDCGRYDTPKANQAYLWGLTKAGNKLWFGTAANMLCLVRAFNAYSDDDSGGTWQDLLSNVHPYQNDLWACEYDDGLYPQSEMVSTVPEIFSDYRPPQIYTYDISARVLTNMTDAISGVTDRLRLENTFGLRSAGSIGNLV